MQATSLVHVAQLFDFCHLVLGHPYSLNFNTKMKLVSQELYLVLFAIRVAGQLKHLNSYHEFVRWVPSFSKSADIENRNLLCHIPAISETCSNLG